MNFALVATAPILGGVWRHVVDLANGLQSLDADVVVVAPESLLPALQQKCPSVQFEKLGSRVKADVTHLHLADTYDHEHGKFIRHAARASRVVVTEHLPRTIASDPAVVLPGVRRKPGATQWKTVTKRRALARARAIITVSEEDRMFLTKRYGIAPERVVAIPLEIDSNIPPTPMPDSSRFVSAGSVITQKGFDVLVEASAFRTTSWTVDVFGSGPHLERLQRRAVELGGYVQFCGQSVNVLSEMDNSRGVVIPSRWESGPYVLLEAMSRARPVIASRIDAMPRIVTQSDCGVLFEMGNPRDLARALDECMNSGDVERLGTNGYKSASTMSVKNMAGRTLEVYQKVLS